MAYIRPRVNNSDRDKETKENEIQKGWNQFREENSRLSRKEIEVLIGAEHRADGAARKRGAA